MTTSKPLIVAGAMGGSASAVLALPFVLPEREVLLHEDYDLPAHRPENALYLAVSYSGDTEETLSFARSALKEGRSFAAVACGGALAEIARSANAPLVLVESGLVPRNALPHMLRAILKALKEEEALKALADISLPEDHIVKEAEPLSRAFESKTPIFYTSTQNQLLGRIAKMFCDESAKIPAFMSVLPARDHDELQGFDPTGPHASLDKDYLLVFILDKDDDDRVERRFEVMRDLLGSKMSVYEIRLPEGTRLYKLLYFWRLMQEATSIFAKRHNIDPDSMPVTEAFKKML